MKALQRADKTLSSNLDNIELEDLPGIADSARQSVEQVETTIDGQPIDTRRPTILITVGRPGRVEQSVGHLTRKSGVLGSIPGLATYFRFSFRFFKKGSCQLLAKVCARSTG